MGSGERAGGGADWRRRFRRARLLRGSGGAARHGRPGAGRGARRAGAGAALGAGAAALPRAVPRGRPGPARRGAGAPGRRAAQRRAAALPAGGREPGAARRRPDRGHVLHRPLRPPRRPQPGLSREPLPGPGLPHCRADVRQTAPSQLAASPGSSCPTPTRTLHRKGGIWRGLRIAFLVLWGICGPFQKLERGEAVRAHLRLGNHPETLVSLAGLQLRPGRDGLADAADHGFLLCICMNVPTASSVGICFLLYLYFPRTHSVKGWETVAGLEGYQIEPNSCRTEIR